MAAVQIALRALEQGVQQVRLGAVGCRPDVEQASGRHASHAGDPSERADGVVLAVDRAANSVTISHGPLYNLGMPPMTMGFQVGNPDFLERIKPGDKVRFHVDVIGGAFTVMNIEPAN